MPTTGNLYYYSAGKTVPLIEEPDLFALKLTKEHSPLSKEAMAILQKKSAPVLTIPNYQITVYKTNIRSRAISVLNKEKNVNFATPVFSRSSSIKELMFINRLFLVQFKDNVTIEQIKNLNDQYGVQIVDKLGYAENGFILEAPLDPTGLDVIKLANIYFESGKVKFAHPNFITRRRFASKTKIKERNNRNDTENNFLDQQWHLQTAKVTEAWNITKGNSNIKIAILDDGVDLSHPEFRDKIFAQYDWSNHVEDGNPKNPEDNHGTSCAGVAIAAGIKAFGVAPECSLIVARTPDYLGVDDEARMFQWATDQGADVISCSWGPPDGLGSVTPLPDNVAAAIRYCLTNGRGGKGIPIFWAAGNGNESVMDDGYASNPGVIAVAASTSKEQRAGYSDHGSAIWVCAPSSGWEEGEKSIFTTDRMGANGYNSGDTNLGDSTGAYTNDFGGTSSATPLVAGIAALMLSVNPSLQENLNEKEVREILAKTADRIGSIDSYSETVLGRHSDEFGYGRVNALAAVGEAQTRAGGTPTNVQPSITALIDSIAVTDDPPSFDIDPGSHAYYAVEISSNPELFDYNNHANERTDDNFFASWDSGEPLLSVCPYTLPKNVWDRLKGSDRLYYRAWVSDSPTEWINAVSTTSDNNWQDAPYILVENGTRSGRNAGRILDTKSARKNDEARWRSPH